MHHTHTLVLKGTAKMLTAGFDWLGVDAAVIAASRRSVSNTTVASTGLHITHDSN